MSKIIPKFSRLKRDNHCDDILHANYTLDNANTIDHRMSLLHTLYKNLMITTQSFTVITIVYAYNRTICVTEILHISWINSFIIPKRSQNIPVAEP